MKMLLLCGVFALASCNVGGSTVQSQGDSSPTEIVYKYEVEQMYQKVWEGNEIYNESVCFIEREDGRIYGTLLYEPTKILAIKNYNLQKDLDENLFEIEGNKIILKDKTKIPYFTQENLKGKNLDSAYGISTYNANESGTEKIMFTEGVGIVMHHVNVSYIHNGKWNYEKPKYKGYDLPNTLGKLEKKENLSVVFYGDSIMTGCNSSSKLGIEPFQDDFPTGFKKELERIYGGTVEMYNTSLGGTLSNWGVENIEVNVTNYNPDLVVLGFGMNDGSWNVPTSDFVGNIEFMIKAIKAKNEKAEVIVVATIVANPDSLQYKAQDKYLAPLEEMSNGYLGVTLLDMTTFSQNILKHKNSLDIYANNINHPSDFMVRAYVANLINLLVK